MFNVENYKAKIDGKDLILEMGKFAGQATGAVTARYGDTVILATAVVADSPRDGIDFFPLLVDYEERLYAAGKISGSRFIKREGRPSDAAILTCRLIDRPLRPLFPKSFRNDVQIIITVLSFDPDYDPDVIAIVAASAALVKAGAPFNGPIAALRVGMNEKGEFIINPSRAMLETSKLDLVVAGTKEKVMMLEAGANEVPEDKMYEAIEFAHKNMQPLIKVQGDMAKGMEKMEIAAPADDIHKEIEKILGKKLTGALKEVEKEKRNEALKKFEQEILEGLEGNYKIVDLKAAFNKLVEKEVRRLILEDGRRPDGRKIEEIRPIDVQVGLLPRTHGSGLFTRGSTQALTIATLGGPGEEQIIETMEEEGEKRYMHHYNFPPFSTGEVKPMRSTGRREIGHGALAERALLPMVPGKDEFPYTIRLVSEILSSNGSSSMASVCGSTLALMDAGVPIKKPVSGIAMGLITEEDGDGFKVLTDLQGIEDFSGDMDFKVAGTKDGITAIQLDIKIPGLRMDIIKHTLEQARKGRMEIMEKMIKVISEPRKDLSPYAPRISLVKISPEKIGELIGPGGKNINKIIMDCGGKEVLSIDIDEDGTVSVASIDAAAAEKACKLVSDSTREIKSGEILVGEIKSIQKDRMSGKEIGAIVQITPKIDGMVHISQLADYRVEKVSDVVHIGDKVPVMVLDVDKERGRVSLSIKAAKTSVDNNDKKFQK
jgi:polyribonucleotide nucleotidyltransferase